MLPSAPYAIEQFDLSLANLEAAHSKRAISKEEFLAIGAIFDRASSLLAAVSREVGRGKADVITPLSVAITDFETALAADSISDRDIARILSQIGRVVTRVNALARTAERAKKTKKKA